MLGEMNKISYKSFMNLGVAGSTAQVSVLLLIVVTVAPIVIFFGIVKIKSELNKRKAKKA